MKIWTTEHVFNHPWETVTQAFWRKYPNPMNPNVTGIDVLDRTVSNGVLKSHRLIASHWGMPGWAHKILGCERVAYASEYSEVDPQSKTLKLETQNLTFTNNIRIDESLTYTPHLDNPDQTVMKQETVVKVYGVPLSSYCESLITNTANANAAKGRQAMEWVISKINAEVRELAQCADIIRSTSIDLKKSTVTVAENLLDDLQTLTTPKPGTMPKL